MAIYFYMLVPCLDRYILLHVSLLILGNFSQMDESHYPLQLAGFCYFVDETSTRHTNHSLCSGSCRLILAVIALLWLLLLCSGCYCFTSTIIVLSWLLLCHLLANIIDDPSLWILWSLLIIEFGHFDYYRLIWLLLYYLLATINDDPLDGSSGLYWSWNLVTLTVIVLSWLLLCHFLATITDDASRQILWPLFDHRISFL